MLKTPLKLGAGGNKLLTALIGIAVLLALPFVMQGIGYSYGIYILCIAELYFIAVSGCDILTGYCGQVNMGVAGFYAIGSYGSGILHKYCGVPAVLSMIIAAVLAAVVGIILAYPCSKLQFHFLTLATIAFGEIVNQLVAHSPNMITGNYNGFYGEKLSIFGYKLNSNIKFYFFGLVCVALFILIKHRIVHSKIGRALCAVRDNVKAADGMGINVKTYKVIAMAASALFTGFAGGMYMYLVGFISPDSFTQKQSVMFLTMLIFGGVTSFGGSVIGVVAIMLLTELMRSFTGFQTLLYGALILLVVLLIPGGVYGTIQNLRKKAVSHRSGIKKEG